MKVYQINYDLRKQRNYDELYKKIMSLGNWCHPLESCWLIASEKTASQIVGMLFFSYLISPIFKSIPNLYNIYRIIFYNLFILKIIKFNLRKTHI